MRWNVGGGAFSKNSMKEGVGESGENTFYMIQCDKMVI